MKSIFLLILLEIIFSFVGICDGEVTYQGYNLTKSTFAQLKDLSSGLNNSEIFTEMGEHIMKCMNQSSKVEVKEQEQSFQNCICNETGRACYNLYCPFPQLLSNDNKTCEDSTTGDQIFVLYQHAIFIYNDTIKEHIIQNYKAFDASSNRKTDWEFYNNFSHYDVLAFKKLEDGSAGLIDIIICTEHIFNISIGVNEWINDHLALIIFTNSVTVVAVLVGLLLFCIFPRMRDTVQGKCWCLYLITGLVDYIIALVFLCSPELLEIMLEHGEDDLRFTFLFISYYAMELSIYFWLNIMAFEIFINLMLITYNKMSMIYSSQKKKLRIYCLIGYGIPLLISAVLHLYKKDFFKVGFQQRIFPKSTYDVNTGSYTKGFGMAEIVIKSSCVFFLITNIWFFKRGNKTLSKLDIKAIIPAKVGIERCVIILRIFILFMITLGSLLCNILVFVLSQFLDKETICNNELGWLSNVNPVFEICKRMNAVNILFLIVSEKINWKIISNNIKQKHRNYTLKATLPSTTSKTTTIVDITRTPRRTSEVMELSDFNKSIVNEQLSKIPSESE